MSFSCLDGSAPSTHLPTTFANHVVRNHRADSVTVSQLEQRLDDAVFSLSSGVDWGVGCGFAPHHQLGGLD